MIIRWLGLVGMAALTSAAHAADGEGKFSIRGGGLLTCDIYVQERSKQSKTYYMIGGWLDGYITGRNQFSPDTYDVTSFESTELLALILDGHCKEHPKDRLFSVVNTIFNRYENDRLRTGSPFVTIEVGKRKSSLYRETMRRVQQQLKQRGHYYGKVDGEFNSMTQLAIERFQQELKLKPTGFPDQSTLWYLLRPDDKKG